MLWSYTNFGGDYYWFMQEDSGILYEHFLKSLRLDPQNALAKKGIAG